MICIGISMLWGLDQATKVTKLAIQAKLVTGAPKGAGPYSRVFFSVSVIKRFLIDLFMIGDPEIGPNGDGFELACPEVACSANYYYVKDIKPELPLMI